MAKNFFGNFDDETRIKLEILENYFKEWLPVFIQNSKRFDWNECYVFDFFAGKGKDENGRFGSPLILLDIINQNLHKIKQTGLKVNLILNEYNESYYEILNTSIKSFIEEHNIGEDISIVTYNKDFKVLFKEYNFKSNKPMFMFLDQFGVKQITEDVFQKLISFQKNDFLFFISSSFIRRFNELEEFNKYIQIKKESFEGTKTFHSHRVVFNYYKSLISNDYKIVPFSIKKNANIHGLIFGSNHSYGVEKFLKVCWRINPNTGDANFNIDEEKILEGQRSIFEEDNRIKKLTLLENNIKEWITNESLSLRDLYLRTLEFGCLPKHANSLLRNWINENKIEKVKLENQKIHKVDSRIKIILK